MVLDILLSDEAKRIKMGKDGADFVKDRFGVERTIEKYSEGLCREV